MTTAEYLLAGLAVFLLVGGGTLFTSVMRAAEGFEDEYGFHFGLTPALMVLYPQSVTTLAYVPAEPVRAEVPDAPKPRRNAGSKPPMLPANLEADDLNPRPVIKPADQASNHTQAPFPTDRPPTS